MKQRIYNLMPNFGQCLLISLYNFRNNQIRRGGKYDFYFQKYKMEWGISREDLIVEQHRKYKRFLRECVNASPYYKKMIGDIEGYDLLENIKKLPILKKEDLRSKISDITIGGKGLVKSKTGGTTGKSLTVKYTKDNRQERFALLDVFRGTVGYQLGKKTAWFSGKNLLTPRDINKRRFWKDDFFTATRFYSTFHIHKDNLEEYINNLNKFQPEFLVGFPSAMNEIAKFGLSRNISFNNIKLKGIFPTSETVSMEIRENIESFFGTRMFDQYASSEGAPFIFECKNGKLHLELRSGVYEVLDENGEDSNEGRLIITSFTTKGTPLIRYDIGDIVKLGDVNFTCGCGNHNPIVESILGRDDDFLFSPVNGKISASNISNIVKGTDGIVKFQIIQNKLDSLNVYLVIDDSVYSTAYNDVFLSNLKDRFGNSMNLEVKKVKDIPVERSGKFRMIKNNIKHLIE